MPDGISKANARQSAKWQKSSKSRRAANLPSKAGRRKPPAAKKGKHVTTHEERKRGMWLAQFGLKPFKNPWQSKKLIPMNDGAEVFEEQVN